MLLDLWNFLRGYVIIEVSGFSVERFVNLAVHRGVFVWDVKYSGSTVRMKVSVKGFKKLKECARKTRCRFRITQKKGYPFMAYKYRKRKIFAFGIALFAALMFFLSSFIWLVEVEGTERLENGKILEFCHENGLYIGAQKYKIERKQLEQLLMENFRDISFINISVKGTKATITIAETIPKEDIIDKSVPCDIIAAKDGIITSVYIMNGTPMVKEKDIVSKGDILVSGVLAAGEEGIDRVVTGYTHSTAEVRAKVYYEMHFNVDREYTVKNFTGNEKNMFSLNIINKELSFIKNSKIYENYDKITKKIQLEFGSDYPLPVIVTQETYKEYIPSYHERSLEQMKEIAAIMVNNRIIREFDFDADIIEKVIEYTETPSGLIIKATITTNENIGETKNTDFEPIGE